MPPNNNNGSDRKSIKTEEEQVFLKKETLQFQTSHSIEYVFLDFDQVFQVCYACVNERRNAGYP